MGSIVSRVVMMGMARQGNNCAPGLVNSQPFRTAAIAIKYLQPFSYKYLVVIEADGKGEVTSSL